MTVVEQEGHQNETLTKGQLRKVTKDTGVFTSCRVRSKVPEDPRKKISEEERIKGYVDKVK